MNENSLYYTFCCGHSVIKARIFFYKQCNKQSISQIQFERELMQKTQVKPRKDKKKNTQTGLLMGQNTNIFSQLSASYLTSKAQTTQQEEHFVKQIQIIQYHDQNINRLISLLRKKAQVTKVKAVMQLKQAILDMSQNQIQQFMPTYANLFQEIVVNEQSKQVYEEFVQITCSIVEKYKKVALKQVATLFPTMLISVKLSKVTRLLFKGTQQQMSEKAYVLFMNKQVRKKYLLISKFLLQTQQTHLIPQSNYQRNLQQYVRSLKELLSTYLNHSKRDELRQGTGNLLREICDLLWGKTIDEYFKCGGKGKASLLECYEWFVHMASVEDFDIPWKKMAKIVFQNFLDKDPVVQSVMWKNCNRDQLLCMKELARKEQKQDQFALFHENLPKADQKLIECLNIGGLSMYKALPSYLNQFPSFIFTPNDTHKLIIQKITFIRKLIQQILAQEDENQARMQCYFSISQNIIESVQKFEENMLQKLITQKQGEEVNQSKKAKQIKNLIQKLRTQIVLNLEKKYYADPPGSKNSFTYYVPEYFCKLLNKYQFDTFNPTFNDRLVFLLYKDIKIDSNLLEVIFSKCEKDLGLLLSFFENWTETGKQVNLDMSENNQEYEKTAKIFLLSNKKRAQNKEIWFPKDWDLRKSAIIYDPRLTTKDLQIETGQDSQHLNIHFTPISKNLQPIYQIPELNEQRFCFFLSLLQNNDIQTQNLKFFLPFLFTHLITEENVSVLLEKYTSKACLLKQNKWVVGQKQIAFLRIAVQAFNIHLLKHEKKIEEQTILKFRPYFLSIGNFLKVLNIYKMDKQVQQILKNLNQLIRIPEYEQLLLQSLQSILQDIFTLINKSSSMNVLNQEKLRKNRLKRINDLVQHSVWYLIRRNSGRQVQIMLDLFSQQHIWRQAQAKIQPWAIGYTILSTTNEQTMSKMSRAMILGFQQNFRMISLLFSCQLLLPLQIYPQFKQSYLKLQHALTKEFSQLQTRTKLLYIQRLMIYQYEQGLLTQSIGLKTLIKGTLKYYETFSQEQSMFLSKDIVQLLIERMVGQKEADPKLNTKSVIAFTILNEFPLQGLSSVEETYHGVLECLQRQVKNLESHFHKFLSMCLLANTFWRTSAGASILLKWQQNQLIQGLLNRLVPQIKQIEPPSTYHSFAIFSTINSLYPSFGFDVIQSNLQPIMRIFWDRKEGQMDSQMYIFKQEERIRFINRVFLDLKTQTAYQIISKLPKQALEEYTHYEKVLLELQDQEQEEQSQSTQKSIHGLFIEYSQLLIKMTSYFSLGQNKTIPDQSTLIELLQCPFSGVKKTCFVLIKQLYDLKLVKSQIPQIFKQVLVYKLKANDQIQDIKTANSIYNFLYSWLTLMSRKKATEAQAAEDQNQQLYTVTLEDYVQKEGLSELFLNNIFGLIADKIDYLKCENDYPLTSQELLQDDFTLNVEEETNLRQKIFSLSCKVLFAYSINFPLYLRTFMDKSKKYRSVCEKLLRNYISDSIFAKQVTMIQVKEPQWKASGNLEIYVVKKNKQIYAEYQHDIIRIGLRLVMRPNYPLTPIHIQFGEGLKMQDGSKWALMLQSQLHNKNNSIINGIILWKENIDKKLSGVEECAICYDIVNPNGHLPKKGCKTCKKKFHGNCIMKWFSKSNKSECPLCKSQFL